MAFFVSFAHGVRSPRREEVRAVAIPERGVFFVVEGAGLSSFANAIDAAVRTSTRSDDVAEVLDGLHEELAARETPVSFAMIVVEDDALAFFGAGTAIGLLVVGPLTRTAIGPQDTDTLGGVDVVTGRPLDNPVRFFRAYVRAGSQALLLSRGAWEGRVRAQPPMKTLEKHVEYLVDGPGSHAPAAAVVTRVDEEPRIR